MIASCSKSKKKENFVCPSGRISPVPAYITQQGSDQEYVKGMNPHEYAPPIALK
jgi:hypothetical protein